MAWRDLETEVRALASTIWAQPFNSELVHDRQIDAYADNVGQFSIAIEVTQQRKIDKLQEDINKLTFVRHQNLTRNRLTECYLIVSYSPTPVMRSVCAKGNITLLTIDEFRFKFIPFELYSAARLQKPFGSAIDPVNGGKDGREYVVVRFSSELAPDCTITTLAESLIKGTQLVMLGEYGTGKSKCVEKLFELLSADAWVNYRFPISIDLRRSWGLRDRYEIIRRHLHELNLSEHVDSMIKAYNDGFLILLIDGFDEIGTHAWSDDRSGLQKLRSDALTGARDLISNQKGALIVTGRDHYFDSHDEMFSCLGFNKHESFVVKTNAEFSYEEITEFLHSAGYSSDVPEWLPRKPLTCEFFINLFDGTSIELFDETMGPVEFWDVFFKAVCDRESGIHPSFDSDSIKKILINVAEITRIKHANIGPISLREIQNAFEVAVGFAPIEQAGVLLQRLPGLGRTASDSEDRQFVDIYLLEGLKALGVIHCVENHELTKLNLDWINPMEDSGLLLSSSTICHFDLKDDFIDFVKRHTGCRNKVLIGDIVSSVLNIEEDEDSDFGSVQLHGAHISTLNFTGSRVSNLFVADCVIDRVLLSGVEHNEVRIVRSVIGKLEGISDETGVPAWLEGNDVQSYTSVATMSRIKSAKITANHKVLIAILRKTYFQRGSARKEEALLRGLGRLVPPGVRDRIINKLLSENLLTKAPGDTGTLYAPVRAQTRRVGDMLSELNLSRDPIWISVGDL